MFGQGRDRVDNRLHALRGVWATAMGKKVVGGEPTEVVCLTVFVSRKLRESTLGSDQVVPKWVTLDGDRLPTDVVALSLLEHRQSSPIPTKAHTLADQNTRGTLAGFVRTGDDFLALGCAHSMAGLDRDPDTDDVDIELANANTGRWIRLGKNVDATYGPGAGDPTNFGFSDAALVHIRHADARGLINTLRNKQKHAVRRLPRSRAEALNLINKPVIGVGALMGQREAAVANVHFRSRQTGRKVDVVVRRPDGGLLTDHGDSGTIWYLETGQALAMHAIGKVTGRSTIAHTSFNMFVARVLKHFRVHLLEP